MSGENILQTLQKSRHTLLFLELAVPVLSFGGAILALIFSGEGSSIDIRYFAFGCVISSLILAYLAWIRPQKDIVALSTPIYSFLFFVVPSDVAVTLLLELLYATSLTILLIRLKFRFGPAPKSGIAMEVVLEEPLKSYCEGLRGRTTVLGPDLAHSAAVAFVSLSQGDYRDVVQVADRGLSAPGSGEIGPVLAMAFAIVREQALLLEESAGQPESFLEFPVQYAGFLVKPLPHEEKIGDRFEVSLENALLLLFAAAWNGSERDHPLLLTGQSFAQRLIAP